MNAALVVVTCELVGTINHYKMVKKNICALCALRCGGDIKTFRLSLVPSASASARASTRASASAR